MKKLLPLAVLLLLHGTQVYADGAPSASGQAATRAARGSTGYPEIDRSGLPGLVGQRPGYLSNGASSVAVGGAPALGQSKASSHQAAVLSALPLSASSSRAVVPKRRAPRKGDMSDAAASAPRAN